MTQADYLILFTVLFSLTVGIAALARAVFRRHKRHLFALKTARQSREMRRTFEAYATR